jgi:hypothetical protein
VVTGGAGVVGDGLRIGAELVGAAAGPSVARGGDACGVARGGSGGGDLALEARPGGRWRQLGVREAAWCWLIAWGHTWGRTATGGTVLGGEAARHLGEQSRVEQEAGGFTWRSAARRGKQKRLWPQRREDRGVLRRWLATGVERQ